MSGAELLAEALKAILREVLAEGRSAAAEPEASLTCAQAAVFLGYTPGFVRQLARSRAIASVGEGRARRFLRADLEAYRRRNRNPGRSAPTPEAGATTAH